MRKYWDYKYQLTSEVQNYINTIAPSSNLRAYALIDECEKYNIDIPIPVLRTVLRYIANEVNQKEHVFDLYNDDSFWIKDYVFEDYDGLTYMLYEEDATGTISNDPENHHLMVEQRAKKVALIA